MTIEEFPFNNQYYDLVKGETLSKRGKWWTAVLLVKPKAREEEGENEIKEKKDPKLKVMIQRWQGFKQDKEVKEYNWRRSKDFTISSRKQWLQMRETIEKWVEDEEWK
ncbi:MAG: hypothetical protein ACXAC7_21380 [Candidatus Hodarchaeales archaeon]|jgi:hypothetical protein